MNFGVHLYPFYRFPSFPSIVEYVRRAEGLGYSYVNIPEHSAFPVEQERTMGQVWWDPIVLAAHLADATKTIRLHFSILILPQHNPFSLAKQLATLDHVSNGRIALGVGIGWLADEMRLMGADFHQRAAVTEEYIKAIRALWTTHPSAYQGRFLSFSDISSHPKPVQKPHPPIHVGGSLKTSPKRAALLGDGWVPTSGPQRDFEAGLKVVKETLQANGRSMRGFAIERHLPLFDRNPEVEAHRLLSGGVREESLGGDHQRAIEHVRRYEELGVTHMLVDLKAIDFPGTMRELEEAADKVIHRL